MSATSHDEGDASGQERHQHDEQRPRNAVRYALAASLKLTAVRERFGLLAGQTEPETAAARDFNGANLEVLRTVMSEARRRADEWKGQLYFVYLGGRSAAVSEQQPSETVIVVIAFVEGLERAEAHAEVDAWT